jgi:hypothetical protein
MPALNTSSLYCFSCSLRFMFYCFFTSLICLCCLDEQWSEDLIYFGNFFFFFQFCSNVWVVLSSPLDIHKPEYLLLLLFGDTSWTRIMLMQRSRRARRRGVERFMALISFTSSKQFFFSLLPGSYFLKSSFDAGSALLSWEKKNYRPTLNQHSF